MRMLLLAALNLLAGCGVGDGVVELSVSSGGPLPTLASLRFKISSGVKMAQPPPAAATSLPILVGLVFDKSVSGLVTIDGDALDAGGNVIANGTTTASVQPSQSTRASLVLMGGAAGDDLSSQGDSAGLLDIAASDVALPDLAAPDLASADLAMPDLAMPDLAMSDLAMPDLAMPDFAVPDLAMPDLAMPDFAVPDLAMPDFAMRDFAMLDLAMPDLAMPDLAMPDLLAGDFSMYPLLSVLPAQLSGTAGCGVMTSAPLTVKNNGTAKLTITTITVSGAPYSLSGLPNFPVVLNPGTSFNLSVIIALQMPGVANGTLIIKSDDPKSPTTTVPLSFGAANPGGSLLVDYELDEPMGVSFADSSGRGNIAMAPFGGIAVGSMGHSGKSVNFSGGMLVAGTLPDAAKVRVEAWIQPAPPLNTTRTILALPGSYSLKQVNQNLVFSVTGAAPFNNAPCVAATNANPLVAGTWYHVAGIYDGETASVLVNGVPTAVSCPNGPVQSAGGAQLFVGAGGFTNNNVIEDYAGKIDELRVWGGVRGIDFELDETMGIRFADTSGLCDTGTAPEGGIAVGATGHTGKSVNFSGGVIEVPAPTAIPDSPRVWVEAWVYPIGGLNQTRTILNKAGSYALKQLNQNFSFQVIGAASGNMPCVATTGSNPAVGGQWVRVAGSYDGLNAVVWINGVPATTTACPNGPIVPTPNAPLDVGGILNGNNVVEDYFGKIDELRVWTGARSLDLELDENMGNTFADSSGLGNAATAPLGGVAVGANGHSGLAVHFSGGVVTVPGPTKIPDSPTVWVEAWINPTQLNQTSTLVTKPGSYSLRQVNQDLSFQVFGANNGNPCVATTINKPLVQAGAWQRVAGSYDGDSANLIIGGSVAATVACPNGPVVATPSAPFHVGGILNGQNITESFSGTIDEVRIWSSLPGTAP